MRKTGYADNVDTAISLVIPNELHHFTVIQKKIGKEITPIDIEH